jgi:protocatechuate 3,4-dioxygenase beta subunit
MMPMLSRRDLFYFTTGAGLCRRLAFAGDDPIAALPPDVLKNSVQNGVIMIHHPAPANLSSETSLVQPSEPGERLIIDGQAFAPDGRTPVPGLTVYAYNTDSQGYYGANHAFYPTRLYGWVKTDSAGRFRMHTIHPGHYPNMQVPSHVHFAAWGAGYPPQGEIELRFAGDRYLTPKDLAEDARRGDFHEIRELKHTAGGTLSCDFQFRVQNESSFH